MLFTCALTSACVFQVSSNFAGDTLPQQPVGAGQQLSQQAIIKSVPNFQSLNIATWHKPGAASIAGHQLGAVFPGMQNLRAFKGVSPDEANLPALPTNMADALRHLRAEQITKALTGSSSGAPEAEAAKVATDIVAGANMVLPGWESNSSQGGRLADALRRLRAQQLAKATDESEAGDGPSQWGTAKLSAKKLGWLHFPKAGTSFANTLVSWGCKDLDNDDVVDQSYSDGSGAYVWGFMEKHHKKCADGLTVCGGHSPLDDSSECTGWSEHKGNLVAMFRQPEQRIISGYHQNCHDVEGSDYSLLEYSKLVAGCSVKMMTGHECGANVTVDGDMVVKAIKRLDEGFAFVGLTEKWGLSVCLFHAMFGGKCNRREFLNVRPGAQRADMRYDTTSLQGWTDAYDGALHAHASKIFWNNIAKYGVTADTCKQHICADAADELEMSMLVGGR